MARLLLSLLVVPVLALGLVPGVADAPTAFADHGMRAGHGTRAGGPLVGCGGGQQTVPAPAIAELPRVTVHIYDGFFLPAEISVAPGTVVVWRNMGQKPHTSTAWGYWDSGILRPGEACAAWFVTPGTYEYLSIVAADGGTMTGAITVEGPPIGGGGPTTERGMMPGMGPGMMPGMGPGMGPGPGY